MNDNNTCPSNDFKKGEANGKCWGFGHYMCKECIHYRADFKKHGQEFIDFIHYKEGQIIIKALK